MCGRQLVILETTNGVRDERLYDLISTETLLTWQRIPIANRMGTPFPRLLVWRLSVPDQLAMAMSGPPLWPSTTAERTCAGYCGDTTSSCLLCC